MPLRFDSPVYEGNLLFDSPLNFPAGGEGQTITVDVPFPTSLKWDNSYPLEVTTPEGTATLSNVFIRPATGWEYQDYDGTILNPATTESFQELALSEFGLVLEAGDRFNWESNPALTFRPDGTPIVDPPQTLTFDGFFWDESAQTNTAVVSFTINDLGPPVPPDPPSGEVGAMVQPMVTTMITAMVK